MEIIQELSTTFHLLNGGYGRLYFAPGRVNLIGEHTDYNGGHVFPCALSIGTYAMASLREDQEVHVFSLNMNEENETIFDLINLEKIDNHWSNYVKAMIYVMKQSGYEISQGLNIVYSGNIPNGAGLSSSASIEVLTGYLIADLCGFDLDKTKLALLAQKAENEFIGVQCGIMDQFVIAHGRNQHAILLDTNKLSYQYAPLQLGDVKIVIVNTNKQRKLEASQYNQRRSECEEALKVLQKEVSINSLGDLDEQMWEKYSGLITNDILKKRAKHAVLENQRTLQAVQALGQHDFELFGKLMQASHRSLKEDYEVTGVELDTLVELAMNQKGVIGARMTGAGFGGCTVNLVEKEALDRFIDEVKKGYTQTIGYEPTFIIASVGEGVHRLSCRLDES